MTNEGSKKTWSKDQLWPVVFRDAELPTWLEPPQFADRVDANYTALPLHALAAQLKQQGRDPVMKRLLAGPRAREKKPKTSKPAQNAQTGDSTLLDAEVYSDPKPVDEGVEDTDKAMEDLEVNPSSWLKTRPSNLDFNPAQPAVICGIRLTDKFTAKPGQPVQGGASQVVGDEGHLKLLTSWLAEKVMLLVGAASQSSQAEEAAMRLYEHARDLFEPVLLETTGWNEMESIRSETEKLEELAAEATPRAEWKKHRLAAELYARLFKLMAETPSPRDVQVPTQLAATLSRHQAFTSATERISNTLNSNPKAFRNEVAVFQGMAIAELASVDARAQQHAKAAMARLDTFDISGAKDFE
ncbi:uncharacterized protein HMPREF1541_10457 [Cyphellophora europaea CBS 101466]|uniref:Uncharacterized protein n=1 Tax=Cyphellophora europaea (strain CBS 101466) TaxID=1220924 RepID=W2S6G2_CYPE1|nr:uncharacterized protein HMPREF1541_10457 [Cyphellophora europaea CBS 101466]ETN44277.1 hypothetical protein HMPREF1541_10457 [Cyphellophora europaea CBS 101466]